MPANPETPHLTHELTLPQALLWRVGWTVARVWLIVQGIQIGMNILYRSMGEPARDFWFGDWIAYWDTYGEELMSFSWTSWLKSVPMWWDWQAYVIALVFMLVLFGMSSNTRALRWDRLSGLFRWLPTFERAEQPKGPSPSPEADYSRAKGPSGPPPDDDFDPSKFQSDAEGDDDDFSRFWKRHQGDGPEPKTDAEKAEKLLALIYDPRTPEPERESAERALKRLAPPPKQITHRKAGQ